MKRKIKIFLGAYINQTNAQNLNCRSLAVYLDKRKFDVLTLAINHGNLGAINLPGVKIFNCHYPVKITQYLGYFWGIANSDVAYLPRGNSYKFQRFLVHLFKRRSFKTIENIIDTESLTSALAALKDINEVVENYTFTTRCYSITHFMRNYNLSEHGLASEENILYPIIDTTHFKAGAQVRSSLKRLIFIGNDMKRKGVNDLLELARIYPDLSFSIIGKDNMGLDKFLENPQFKNVRYLGVLNHDELTKELANSDLHILPSKSEGFPRSIIECAANGVPSIVYADYGADEWIDSGVNGFVCDSFEGMRKAVLTLKNSDELMMKMSKEALKLSDTFQVEKVVEMYETVIEELYES